MPESGWSAIQAIMFRRQAAGNVPCGGVKQTPPGDFPELAGVGAGPLLFRSSGRRASGSPSDSCRGDRPAQLNVAWMQLTSASLAHTYLSGSPKLREADRRSLTREKRRHQKLMRTPP